MASHVSVGIGIVLMGLNLYQAATTTLQLFGGETALLHGGLSTLLLVGCTVEDGRAAWRTLGN